MYIAATSLVQYTVCTHTMAAMCIRYGYVVPGKDDVVEAEQQQEGEDGEEEQRQDGAGPSNAGAEVREGARE
jgi:hypothetical protein